MKWVCDALHHTQLTEKSIMIIQYLIFFIVTKYNVLAQYLTKHQNNKKPPAFHRRGKQYFKINFQLLQNISYCNYTPV